MGVNGILHCWVYISGWYLNCNWLKINATLKQTCGAAICQPIIIKGNKLDGDSEDKLLIFIINRKDIHNFFKIYHKNKILIISMFFNIHLTRIGRSLSELSHGWEDNKITKTKNENNNKQSPTRGTKEMFGSWNSAGSSHP